MFSSCEEALVSSSNHIIVLKLFSKVSHSCLHLSEVQMKILLDCPWPREEMHFALSESSILTTELVGCSVGSTLCRLLSLQGPNWLLLEFNLNDAALQQG